MKKQFFAILMCVCMAVTLLPTGALAADGSVITERSLLEADPAGLSLHEQLNRRQLLAANNDVQGVSLQSLSEEESPYIISSAAQLAELATLVNAGDAAFISAHYELAADIDLSAVCGAEVGEDGSGVSWTPIGDAQNHSFNGVFDGKNHSVSGLYINSDNAGSYHGLFGIVLNCTIKNVEVVDVNISVDTPTVQVCTVGGVVGNAGNSTVQNCHSSGKVNTDSDIDMTHVGGVVGVIIAAGEDGKATLENCSSSATVSSSGSDVGGVAGRAAANSAFNGNCTVRNCSGSGIVSGSKTDAHVGGVVGLAYGRTCEDAPVVCTVEDCSSTAAVNSSGTAPNVRLGGVVGKAEDNVTVKNCTDSSLIAANSTSVAGGVVGEATGSSVEGCMGNTSIHMVSGQASGEFIIGGVVGQATNSSVKKCCNTSAIIAPRGKLGGVVGQATNSSSIENCYSSGAVIASLGGEDCFGGVVGQATNSSVKNCYSSGAVKGVMPADQIGGVVGKADTASNVTNCVALNPSVTGGPDATGDNIGAVLGGMQSPYASSSYYWDGMWAPKKRNDNSRALTYDSASGLSTQFSEIFGEENPAWNYTENGRPTLVGVGVDGTQHSALPHYITQPETVLTEISTPEQLLDFAAQVNGTGSYAGSALNYAAKIVKLTADIDLSTICGADVDGGTSWTPIGTERSPFCGIFDGNGYTVSGLYINGTDDYQGLFGIVTDATLKNVAVVNVNITAGDYVGGVVGSVEVNAGVENCYSSGTVSANDDGARVGGVAGFTSSSNVKNCYSSSAVNAGGEGATAGGVVGRAYGNVQNCYSSSAVNAGGEGATAGGVVGQAYGGVQYCVALNPGVSGGVNSTVGAVAGEGSATYIRANYYWSGMSVRVKGVEQTKEGSGTTELSYDSESGLSTQFDDIFDSAIADGAWHYTENGLPVLKNVGGEQHSELPNYITTPGAATAEISTAAQLLDFAEQVNGTGDYAGRALNYAGITVRLTADIDLSSICGADVDGGTNWTPIGTYAEDDSANSHPFSGTFEGDGHTVTGLYINNTDNYQGLFGYIFGGTVKNVGLVNASISANDYVGGVVGRAENDTEKLAVVQNCYSSGAVSGGNEAKVGGVAGVTSGSTVQNCYSNATVSGGREAKVGGVAGAASDSATMQYCYSIGAVSGGEVAKVGGVLGDASGDSTVQNNVALNPSVSGGANSTVGVMVSGNDGATINGNYYWDGMAVMMNGEPQDDRDKNDSIALSYDSVNRILSAQFSAIFGETNPAWSYTENGLPTLKNVGGEQRMELPLYITGILRISTVAQLQDFAAQVNGGNNYSGITVLLTADINLSGVCGANVGESGVNWTAIGTYAEDNPANSHPFSGIFDGDGHTIAGLHIDNTDNYQGLFGYIFGGTVKNVGLVNVNIAANNYAGGVVGLAKNDTEKIAVVQNCFSSGAVCGGGSEARVGGVAGGISGSNVQNCYSTCAVSGGSEAKVGGVVGCASDSANVQNCYSIGAVSGGGDARVGGVVGVVDSSTVCQNVALNPSLSGGANSYVGALVGQDGVKGISGNHFWGGMSVMVDGNERIPMSSDGCTALMLSGGFLYDGGAPFDWEGFTGVWTMPTYELGLPYFTGSGHRPALPLAYKQVFKTVFEYVADSNQVMLVYAGALPQNCVVFYAEYSDDGRMTHLSEVAAGSQNKQLLFNVVANDRICKAFFISEDAAPLRQALVLELGQ